MKLLVVRKNIDIDRAIIVSCKDNDKIKNNSDLTLALINACSKWAETPEGRIVYDYSSGDFNFGDLLSYIDEVQPFLIAEGVEEFKIDDDLQLDHVLHYDTVLMTEPSTLEGNFAPGNKVFWHDPDDGLCSKQGVNNDTVKLEDGTECLTHELQLVPEHSFPVEDQSFMKLQEFTNDGTKWVLVGTFNQIPNQDEAELLVAKWQDGNKKFVLLDDEDDFVKEYLP